ncbi:hypothetical protein M758_8G131100 [Ceratodon purpureus]|nr:hypothetical protein M758_8G131100 [Ceratodon purpureus]
MVRVRLCDTKEDRRTIHLGARQRQQSEVDTLYSDMYKSLGSYSTTEVNFEMRKIAHNLPKAVSELLQTTNLCTVPRLHLASLKMPSSFTQTPFNPGRLNNCRLLYENLSGSFVKIETDSSLLNN